MFASIPDNNLQKTGAEQVRQILRGSLAVATYAEDDPRVREFFYIFFYTGQSFAALVNGNQFLQTVLNSAHRNALATLDVAVPSFLEFHMFLHSIAMVEEAIYAKTLKRSCQ